MSEQATTATQEGAAAGTKSEVEQLREQLAAEQHLRDEAEVG